MSIHGAFIGEDGETSGFDDLEATNQQVAAARAATQERIEADAAKRRETIETALGEMDAGEPAAKALRALLGR